MSRRVRVALASCALVVAAAAPLATTFGQPAGAATTDGARSLNDAVTVNHQPASGLTADIHVTGFNDFHGNIDPNPVVPESSFPVLLPITAMLVVGAAGAFVLVRRHRRT